MAQAPLNVTPLFAVPLVEFQHPASEPLNAELKALFLARAGEGDRYRNRLMTAGKNGLFESEFDLFKWPEACVQRLKAFCLESLVRTVAELSRLPEARVRSFMLLDDTWFHITRTGGYTTAHNHPMASWSGVYCVDPGDSPPEHPDSGVLRFFDTRVGAAMFLDPANSKLARPYGFHIINHRFQPGQLVLFPSYLQHEVAPYMGQSERITVAFNVAFRAGFEAAMTATVDQDERRIEAAKRALAAGDVSGAMQDLEALATDGSRQARLLLFGLYIARKGPVPQDTARAYRELTAAALEPWPPADMLLAACDRCGIGVTADATRAWQRLRLALEQGHAVAWRTYGMLRALASDLPAAQGALRWAFASGDSYSAHVLGLLAMDAGANAEAAAWFERSPKLGVSRRRRAQLPDRAGALELDAELPPIPAAEPWPFDRPAPQLQHLHQGAVGVSLARRTLSRIECDHLIAVGEPSMVRSMIVDPMTGASRVDPVRTSDEMSYADAMPDLIVREAELRMAAAADHPLESTEPMVSLHYAPGGQYLPHHDYYTEAAMAAPGHGVFGQRVATVIAYLNRVAGGGGTAFPRLGLEVAPEEGAALVFRNVGADGAPLEDSQHAGLPVRSGEKRIATLWCSDRPVRRSLMGPGVKRA